MAREEVHDIVIVGGGICGLALCLGLHRKGIKSLVLERSKYLRSEGAAITVHGNGWHALDQLKVGTELRNFSIPLTETRYESVIKDDNNVKPRPYGREVRCLRRKDLIENLARHIPAEQIRFGYHVSSVDFDMITNLHVLTTRDGTRITAKVLIGCDGSYSLISKSLNMAPPKFFPIRTTRGLTTYPEGHNFGNHFLRLTTTDGTLFGRLPIDDKTIHFFVAQVIDPAGDMNEPKSIKEYTMALLKGTPSEITDTVKNCDTDTLNMKLNGYKSPWSILNQDFRRGTLTVAGDAMHQMGPFIGQGGSSALEDAIVLTRCLSNVINAPANASYDKKWIQRVEDALDLYIHERRPRIMKLGFQSYLVGTLESTKSWIAKMAVIFLLTVFFGGKKSDPALFDCGTI
ncbi:hypothetical protein LUZ60_014325 [Juncus effusus]|nr:hypothetical protein LUZ60_014325 [Juncus effusus]